MPLRPATFNPYPAQDRRAAARERYYRALEEARRAKEAYADAVAEADKTSKPDDEDESPPVTKQAMPASPAMLPVAAPYVAINPPLPPPPPPPAASSSSTPATTAGSAFEEWVRANMGVPSVFAQPEAAEPAAKPTVEEARSRRRAALSVTQLASSPEPSDSSPTPPATAPAPPVPERTPLQQLADAAEAESAPSPATSRTPSSTAAAPASAPTPVPVLPGPKPKSPSPTPQHIPLFTCPSAASSSSAPKDPLAEITLLAQTLAGLKKSFVFPERLDLPPPREGEDVKLPVCARNLAVHAYEHALHKILARLEGVGNVRARGVREKRKDAVKDVKDELERVRREVARRAREGWGR